MRRGRDPREPCRDIDDAAIVANVVGDCLDQEERRLVVNRHHLVERGFARLLQGYRGRNAGIVHQNVEGGRTRLGAHGFAELRPEAVSGVLAVSEIGLHGHSLDAEPFDVADSGIGRIRIGGVMHADQRGTFFRESKGCGSADTARASGD